MSEKFLKNLNGDIIGINIKWVLEKNKEIDTNIKEIFKNIDKSNYQQTKYYSQAHAFRELTKNVQVEEVNENKKLENKIALAIFKSNQSGLHDVTVKFNDAIMSAKKITLKIKERKKEVR